MAPAALAGLSFEDLCAHLEARAVPRPHAERLVRASLRQGVADLEKVEGLGARNLERLGGDLALRTTRVVGRTASLDGTVKLLVETDDGERVESVLMPLAHRLSGCVSSQVGCGAACAFCASGLGGLRRSLRTEEIVEQVLHLRDEARGRDLPLSNLVFMGMGEPLHAYDAVVGALRRLTDPRLLGFGAGHVTVSTVGIVPGILALAEENLGVHLAVSVHAADEALRRRLLPVGGRWPLAEVLDAAERYRVRTRRFVTLQVTLMRGVNDGVAHATALAQAIDGRRFHVNLIPVNRIEGAPFEPPAQEAVSAFLAELVRLRVVAHVRQRRGSEVDAACGQLRRRAGATPA